MGVVCVDDAKPALAEETALAFHIILEACMLIFSDMIGSQIRKNTDIKENAGGAV